jgi:PAS domain-containing protein
MTFFDSPLFNLFASVILLIIGAAVTHWYNRKSKAEEKASKDDESKKQQDRDLYLETLKITQDQVKALRQELVDTRAKHDAEMSLMRKTQNDLREKVSMLKTNILTMSMFGTDGPTAMWAKDLHGRRTWHNEEYEKLTGYKLEDCMLKTDLEITGSEALAKSWGANDDEVVRKGIYVVTVEPCVHKDRPKDIFYVLVIKWPRRIGGQIVGVDGTAHRMDEILTAIKNSKGVESV